MMNPTKSEEFKDPNWGKISSELVELQKQLHNEWVKNTHEAMRNNTTPNVDVFKSDDVYGYKSKSFDRKENQMPFNKSPDIGLYDAPVEKSVLESAVRPWGIWRVLDVDQGYKVKRLEILPDASISLQYHYHRSEHWTIVQGEGKVIVDGNIFKVTKGDHFFVPKQALHKVTNTHLHETLIAIEVQMGEICTEDDIVRC
jgi:mannose-6-phosphate isomerase-like protein (cupin superfamily)